MAEIQRSFLSDSVIYGLGSVLSLGVGFLLIPLYTHALSTAEFGLYEILNVLSNVLFVFIFAGTINSFARFYFDHDDKTWKQKVTATAIAFNVLSFCVIASAVLLLEDWLVLDIIKDERAFFYLDLLLIWMFFEVLYRVGTTFLQVNLLPGAYLATQIVRSSLFVGLCVYLLVYRQRGIDGILTANIIACGVFGGGFLLFGLYWTRLKVSLKLTGEFLSYGLPYLPSALFGLVLGISDRFFLNEYFDLSEVGIYALALKIGVIGTLLLGQAFAKVWGPFVFKTFHREDGKQLIASVYEGYAKLLIVTAFCVALAGPILLPFISAPEYQRAGAMIPIICIGAIIQGLGFSADTGLLVAKKTRYKIHVNFYAAVAGLAANMLLIPTLGMVGAALAYIIAMATILVGNIRYSNRFYRLSIEWWLLAKGVGLGSLVYLAFFTTIRALDTDHTLLRAMYQSGLALLALAVFLGATIVLGLIKYDEFATFGRQIAQMFGIKNRIAFGGKKRLLAKILQGRFSPLSLLMPRYRFSFPAIIVYHRIFRTPADYPMTTSMINGTPEEFEEQLVFLKKHYNVINFQLLHRIIKAKEPIPQNSIIITFDDGYFDNHQFALPLLTKHRLTATVFVSTGFIDSGRPFWVDKLAFQIFTMRPGKLDLLDGKYQFDVTEKNRNTVRVAIGTICAGISPVEHRQVLDSMDEQTGINQISPDYARLCRPMTWHEVRELDAAGIEIGAHSIDHGFLDQYDADELRRQLVVSKRRIETELDKPAISMAYPAGKYNQAVVEAAKSAGYEYSCIFNHGFDKDIGEVDFHKLSRIAIGAHMPISLYKAQLRFPNVFL